jgi:hypothetical protein
MLSRIKRMLQAGEITFGLRQAVILSVVGMAIGIAAAVHYAS